MMDIKVVSVEINGISLNNNWFDMNFREKYMKAAKKYSDEIEKLNSNLGDEMTPEQELEYYKKACLLTHNLVDESFGKGTAKKIFEDRLDFLECANVVKILKDSRFKQQEAMAEMTKSMLTEM